MSRPHSSFRNLPIRGLFAVPALLAGVPVAALGAAVWTPSAVWGEERVPELSFINAVVATSRADIGSQVCPRHETLPDIREGDTVALQVRRQRGNWPEQSFRLDFEILSGSTASASDLDVRKTLKNALLRFPATPGAGVSITRCLHIDVKKDLKLEGEEILKLRLMPKAGAGYTVKSGADRQSLTILDDEKSKIRVKYENLGRLGGLPSQRRFNLQLEAGNVSKFQERGCTFTRDGAFSGTIKLSEWRVTGAATLSDFETLPTSVRFRNGVATLEVAAKMDGDTGEESFSIKPARARHGNGDWVGGLRGLVMMCEPTSANVPDGVVGPAGVIAPAAAAPSKPTGLGATASEDQVSLVWTANSDETITGWRYRLRSKGLSRWGSAVVVPSSGSATRRHGVSTSAYFHGVATEFQVQSYNAAGSSPWSDGATATVVNADNPILSISKEGVTVKEGERDTWTVKLNGALAGTVRLSEAERSTAGAIRLSPASLTFTEGTAQTPQTVTVTGVNAGTALLQGKRTAEVVVNHDFTLSGSSITTVAAAGEVVVTVVEGGEAPGAPQRFEARPGNTQVRLEWAAPEDESITGYQVRQRVAGSSGGSWSGWRAISGSGALTTSHVVGKLVNGEKYLFQLRAVNGVGEGAASKRKGATPMGALTVAVGDGRMVEGDEGKKEMEFKVRLSGETVHDVKLQATAVAGSGSTATATGAGRDFLPLSQSVVFAAYGRQHGKQADVNDLEQTVRVEVVGDHLAEGDETFQLRLDNLESEDKRVALAGGGEKTSAVGVIVDDDAAPVLAPLADVTVTAGQAVNITAAATDADGDSLSYTWSRKATESTPALPQGTALNQAKLTFTPTAAGVYTMTVRADDGHGNTATEEVTVTVGAPATVSVPATLQVAEGTDSNAVVRVTASRAFGEAVTFNVSYGGTATADVDYDAVGTVTFNATDTSKDITIPLTDDHLDEDNETMTVNVTPAAVLPGGFELGNATTTVTIVDDDASPVLASLAAVSVAKFETVDITASATDADGDTLSYRWSRADATPGDSNYYCYTYVQNGGVWSTTELGGQRLRFTPATAGSCNMSVTVDDGHGNTASSTVVIAVSNQQVSRPARPTGLAANSGNGEVTLSWDAPNDTSITGYQLQQKAKGKSWGAWTGIQGAGAETVSHTVTGLTNGTTYTYKIRAVNGVGHSEESKGVKATPEGVLTITVNNSHVIEGDEGQTDMVWLLQLSGSPSHEVRLEVRALGARGNREATATGDERDFIPFTKTIVFPANARGDALRQEVRGTVLGDRRDEEDEGVILLVYNLESEDKRVRNYLIGGVQTWRWIIDDDASPVLEALEDVTVTAGQEVDITASATDEDGDTVSYVWSRKAGETTPALPQSTALDQARLTFTPTELGVYTMTVTADDGYGNTATEEVTVTVAASLAPVKPTGFQASPGNQQVTLSWDDPNGNANISKWQVRQKTGSNSYGPWADISGSGAATTSHTVKGLTNGTLYTYQIRAVNGDGNGEASEEVAATPKVATAPKLTWISPGSGVGRRHGSCDGLPFDRLEWTVTDKNPHAVIENADILVGWEYSFRDLDGKYYKRSWKSATVRRGSSYVFKANNMRVFICQSTSTDSSVQWRVRAIGLDRSGTVVYGPWSNTVSRFDVVKPEPAQPTGLAARPGAGEVTLTWNDPGNDSITGYELRQKVSGGSWGEWTGIQGSVATTVSHRVTGLTNGTTYRFKIRAVAGTVEGVASDEVNATPKGVVAPKLTLTLMPREKGGSCPSAVAPTPGPYLEYLEWTVTDKAPHAVIENAGKITGWEIYHTNSMWNNEWRIVNKWTGDVWNPNRMRAKMPMCRAKDGSSQWKVRALGMDQGGNVIYGPWSNTVNWSNAARETGETPEPATVSVPATLQVTEGTDSNAVVTVTASRAFGEAVTFNVSYGGAATADVDYDDAVGSVTFNATDTSKDITIPLTDDNLSEDNETITVTVTPAVALPSGFELGNATTTVTITDDDASVPAPTGLRAYGGNGQVLLRWDNPGDATISKWQVQQDDGTWTDVSIDRTTPQLLDHVVTGLTNGTSYRFKIRAVAGAVAGTASEEVSATAKGVTAPTLSVTATENSDSSTYSANLTWTVADDDPHAIVENAEDITGWVLYYRDKGAEAWTGADIPNAGAATRSYNHSLLGLSGEREYRVRAKGVLQNTIVSGDASYSNTVTLQWPPAAQATPSSSLEVPPSPWVKLSSGRSTIICNADDSQCDSTNYKTRGTQKTVWFLDIAQGGEASSKPTSLQIQHLRTDRPEEGPSEWIDTGWCPGTDCDGPVTTPWPGMINNSRRYYIQGAFLLYEPVPYEISVRVRFVNAAGAGHASSWTTFKGGEYRGASSANYHSFDEGARISISDATVREAAGAELAFKVTLDRSKSQRPQSGLLHVRYVTRDVTAKAGADYTATSGHVSFAPGETEKVVKVAVLDDSHDEASETMELVLWELDYPFGSTRLRDTVGTGTITNTDPIPAAWLGRFGRTVADQALDAVSDRIAAERTPGLSGSLAGQELPHMPFGRKEDEVVSDTTTSDAGDALSEAIYHAATTSGSMSGQDLLLGTNFSLSRGADVTGGNLTFWGRAAYSGFDGKEGDLSLDGEVVTGLLGMDYARQRWLLGLAVSRSGGTGSYNGSDSGEGKIEASLTAGVPYGAWQATDWLKLWGALGYGRGEMTLKPKEQGEIKADLNWTMAAVGARAALLDPEGEGLSLDLLSDALWTRTTSEKVTGLAGTEAEVTRLRLGLEGSWANLLQGGSELTPKFSLGARLDGGDAETGFGMELGGGVVWSRPGAGLSLDLDARTLLFHEADGLKDWGFSAGLVFDPQPESQRGLSVTMGQDWGGEATGGIDALFAANPLEQRSGVEGTSRWTLEAAYGLPAFAGRFTGAPYVGLALAAGARDYTVGWRLTSEVTEQDITFEVKATRSESSDARPDHGVELDIRRTW